MSVVLITGAATGIGNLTAKALAQAGHDVWASMRDPQGRDKGHAQELLGSRTIPLPTSTRSRQWLDRSRSPKSKNWSNPARSIPTASNCQVFMCIEYWP